MEGSGCDLIEGHSGIFLEEPQSTYQMSQSKFGPKISLIRAFTVLSIGDRQFLSRYNILREYYLNSLSSSGLKGPDSVRETFRRVGVKNVLVAIINLVINSGMLMQR
jgi:hypothetical protein